MYHSQEISCQNFSRCKFQKCIQQYAWFWLKLVLMCLDLNVLVHMKGRFRITNFWVSLYIGRRLEAITLLRCLCYGCIKVNRQGDTTKTGLENSLFRLLLIKLDASWFRFSISGMHKLQITANQDWKRKKNLKCSSFKLDVSSKVCCVDRL